MILTVLLVATAIIASRINLPASAKSETKHENTIAKPDSSPLSSSLPVQPDPSKDGQETGSLFPLENSGMERAFLSVFEIDGIAFLSLREIAELWNGTIHYDQVNGTLEVILDGTRYRMLKETPLLEKDGIVLPVECEPVIRDGEIWVPPVFVEQGMQLEIKRDEENPYTMVVKRDKLVFQTTVGDDTPQDNRTTLARMSAAEVIEYLSFLQIPITGAHVSTRDSQLPGAPRSYRNGTHEGIDWYGNYTGIPIDQNTPVLSMADGTVVRVDHDYLELTLEERETILHIAETQKVTPEYILDKLRGRSVWVQHDKGVLVRYVHLSRIPETLFLGQNVRAGDVIGYVGNSGTSYGVEGSLEGLHLHSDILIYGEVFWKYLKTQEIRSVLEHIF